MKNNRVMLIAEKETFLVQVLNKKTKELGIETIFVNRDIDEINARWDEAMLITCYMDTNGRLPEDMMRFLVDKSLDDNRYVILIGEQDGIDHARKFLPADMIYAVMKRPVESADYAHTVSAFFKKMDVGEFRKSILVIDDDPNYLAVVREWLKDTYRVAMAPSGLQGIKWLGRNKADLILLDYEMPITSGPQVLEMLRADNETNSIPVIFLTGKSDRESVMSVVALKPEGYFLKTIGREELLQNLSEFFLKQQIER